MALPGRNITLDYTKLVLSILVITTHTNISEHGLFGWLISDGFARVAVPLFLIVNGYYFANIVNDKAKVKKYIIRLFIIYATWMVIYSPFLWYMTGGGKKLLLINIFTGYYHLWYIASLIGASIVIYLTRKFKLSILLTIALILFFISYAIQKIYLFDIHIFMYPTIVRTFLMMGFPFMFAGYYINKMRLEDKAFFKNTGMLVITAILFIPLLAESAFVYFSKVGEIDPVKDELYLVMPILCPLIFLSVLKYAKYKPDDDGYISKLASSVYFIHIMAIFIITGFPYKADITMFPLYFFLSILLSTALLEVNKRIKIFL
ncbi:acyltransferase family protein [Dysgonomonas sp. BGC7]|uniref:acyltransferase family protein n=1 Tax=Dysgonomonas sp. BGC7 TaxID=1658008 RepID=UPI000680D1CA|nr:acyltransferase family protein [Dysgonomonas sp. BGC7]MBD8389553.1 acyltransferase family protein [Dysgonomonas sp. BGC7]